MGKYSILLCDSDEVYAKRLACELQRQFREQAFVETFTDFLDADSQDMHGDLFLGERLPCHQWRASHPDCTYIWLDAGNVNAEEDGKSDVWHDSIFKYQSASKIMRELQSYLPTQAEVPIGNQTKAKQLWYGVVSPTRHASMIPFACALASCLGKEQRVLLLVLMEFSGIVSLLELQVGQGLESFLLQLRQRKSLEQISFPSVQVLGEFDLLPVLDNPMILYELHEADIQRLIQRIQICRKYDAVVWVGGNVIRGIGELIHQSEKVFFVEKSDSYSRCCQQEFRTFFEKLTHNQDDKLCCVRLPILSGSQTGEHLLWQWNHSVIGEVAWKVLKGESLDGTDNREVSETNSRTVGSEWRDFRSDVDGEDSGPD